MKPSKTKFYETQSSQPSYSALATSAVVFLVIMYLQGIRGLSPLNASLLLVPGYVAGSFLGPIMGRLSDKYGSREHSHHRRILLSRCHIDLLDHEHDSPLYIVLVASAISGLGTSMFFPANNSAVMANARPGSFGSISGLLRTVQNIGLVGSYVLAISVAAASVPREVAFEVFHRNIKPNSGGVSQAFLVRHPQCILRFDSHTGYCSSAVVYPRKRSKKETAAKT